MNDFLNPAEYLNPTTPLAQPGPSVGPQGIQGPAGSTPSNGTNGINAFFLLAAPFTTPSDASVFQITVAPYGAGGTPCTAAVSPGQVIQIGGGAGSYIVDTVNSPTAISIHAYAGVPSGIVINSGVTILPGGFAPKFSANTPITHTSGDTSTITLGLNTGKAIIIKPTAAASGADVILPDAHGYTNQSCTVFNHPLSGRSITVGAPSSQLLNNTNLTPITIAVGAYSPFYSDGTQWYTC